MAILTEDEVREALAGRPAWRRSGDTLVRERALKDWGQALAFLDRIGEAVDDWGRHPDIALTSGNRVRITVANPNGAGITDAEVRLVQMVDAVADAPLEDVERPKGPVAAAAAAASEVAEQPVELVTGSRRRSAVVAAVTAGGLALGVAAAVASRRRYGCGWHHPNGVGLRYPLIRLMPYVVCHECGLRTYCVREDHCPRCDARLRAGAIGHPPRDALSESIFPALALARRELAMDAVLVTEIGDARETVRWALANGWPEAVKPGASWPLPDTVCRRLLDGEIHGAVGDVLAEPALQDIPGLQESGLGAYLGVTLPTDRARLHVLCCLARERRPGLGAGELSVLRGLGESVRAALAAHTDS